MFARRRELLRDFGARDSSQSAGFWAGSGQELRSIGQDWAGSRGQTWSLAVTAGYPETLEITGFSLEKPWSGRRESNPRSQLGKLMFCR